MARTVAGLVTERFGRNEAIEFEFEITAKQFAEVGEPVEGDIVVGDAGDVVFGEQFGDGVLYGEVAPAMRVPNTEVGRGFAKVDDAGVLVGGLPVLKVFEKRGFGNGKARFGKCSSVKGVELCDGLVGVEGCGGGEVCEAMEDTRGDGFENIGLMGAVCIEVQ